MHWLASKRSSLLQGLALYSGSTTIAQFIMMVYVIILARILGPTELGVFNTAYSLVGLTAFSLNLGMDTWMLRKSGLYSDVTILSGSVLKIKAAIGLVWILLMVLLAPLIRPDLYSLPMMAICSIDVFSDVCFNTQIQALNVQKRMKTITWLMFTSRGGRLLGLLVLYYWGIDSAVLFALARMLATVLGLVIATILHKPKFQSDKQLTNQGILKESLPFALSDFLSLIYTNADVTILALLAGKTAVGLYSPASGIIHALYVIPNAIFTVIVPRMTRLGSTSSDQFRELLKPLFGGFVALGAILWFVVGVSGKWVIPLILGQDYQLSGDILTILSSILFLKGVSFSCAIVLVSVGWQHKRLIYQLISALVNIILNIILIPKYSIRGVAWVYVFSELIIALGYVYVTIQWIRHGIFEKDA